MFEGVSTMYILVILLTALQDSHCKTAAACYGKGKQQEVEKTTILNCSIDIINITRVYVGKRSNKCPLTGNKIPVHSSREYYQKLKELCQNKSSCEVASKDLKDYRFDSFFTVFKKGKNDKNFVEVVYTCVRNGKY